MTGKGHEEQFPLTTLSVGREFRKETIAGMRRNGRDAPFPAGRNKLEICRADLKAVVQIQQRDGSC